MMASLYTHPQAVLFCHSGSLPITACLVLRHSLPHLSALASLMTLAVFITVPTASGEAKCTGVERLYVYVYVYTALANDTTLTMLAADLSAGGWRC